jgi:GDPmannose 4,6-dehydratase
MSDNIKIAFITGITGQDGSYLAELLLKKKYKVYGIIRRTSLFNTTRIDHIRNKIILKYGDLTDSSGLINFINEILQTNSNFEQFEIYNLAAQSHVAISFEIPEYTTIVDGVSVMRILEIIKSLPLHLQNKIKFYQAGTSEMYGKALQIPQNETTPFNPISPYAAAKLYGYYITKIYREAYKLYSVNGILFNHESSRRGENFLTMKVINGIKNIILKKQEYIELGNLDSKRDWGYAKDYVYGMWLMMQQEYNKNKLPSDYVLATGNMYSVREFVEEAFKFKNFKIHWVGNKLNEIGIDQDGVIRIRINSKYYRPCEVDLLLGDSSKAQNELNWKPRINTINKLIEKMF